MTTGRGWETARRGTAWQSLSSACRHYVRIRTAHLEQPQNEVPHPGTEQVGPCLSAAPSRLRSCDGAFTLRNSTSRYLPKWQVGRSVAERRFPNPQGHNPGRGYRYLQSYRFLLHILCTKYN